MNDKLILFISILLGIIAMIAWLMFGYYGLHIVFPGIANLLQVIWFLTLLK